MGVHSLCRTAGTVSVCLAFASGCAPSSRQAADTASPRPPAQAACAMDRSKLLIGAYYLDGAVQDDRHVQEVADAGIDFLVAVDAKKELLDLCAKHRLGAITSSVIPMWWGDDGKRAGLYRETLPLEKLDALRPTYPFHPALWGDYPVDEPNAKDFAHINAVIHRYRELFPGQLAYVNLYPIYANTAPQGVSPELQKVPSQLGTTTYQEHIDQYVQAVDTDYICFDSYPFTGPFATYVENLDIVGTACRKSKRDLWVIIQTGAWKPDAVLGEYQIRWQSYLCLAFGAKIVMHASYSPGWWNETTSCINKAGEKNATYDYVKRIDAELHALSDVFMRYDNIGVYPCGEVSRADARMLKQLESLAARSGPPQDRRVRKLLDGLSSDGALVAGCFQRKDGRGRAVLLVNAQNPWSATADVKVRLKGSGQAYIGGKKTPLAPALKLASGEGVFVVLD